MKNNFLSKLFGIFKREERGLQNIPVNSIVFNPYQVRREFDDKSINELAQSMKEHGLINPVIVRKKGNKYELISGERRVRAAKLIGWNKISAFVGPFTDGELLEIALLENLQRKDLLLLEETLGYSRLAKILEVVTRHDLSREISKRIGKEKEEIDQKLSILDMPVALQHALEHNIITTSQAEIIKDIEDKEKLMQLIKKIAKYNIEIDDLKELQTKFLIKKDTASKEQLINLVLGLIKKIGDEVKAVGINLEYEKVDEGDHKYWNIKIGT